MIFLLINQVTAPNKCLTSHGGQTILAMLTTLSVVCMSWDSQSPHSHEYAFHRIYSLDDPRINTQCTYYQEKRNYES